MTTIKFECAHTQEKVSINIYDIHALEGLDIVNKKDGKTIYFLIIHLGENVKPVAIAFSSDDRRSKSLENILCKMEIGDETCH